MPLLLGIGLAQGCATEEAKVDDPELVAEGQVVCERDDSDGPDEPLALTEETVEGFLCPVQDSDWYELSVRADAPVVSVTLEMTNVRSPVQPTYAIWDTKNGEAKSAVAGPPVGPVAGSVSGQHLLPPGDYFIAVRDSGDDEQDVRNHYQLTVAASADPDDAEPNDALDEATALADSVQTRGYVASAGDEDWYAIEVPDGSVVRIVLSMEAGGVQPRVRLIDGEGGTIAEDSNPMGATVDSQLSIVRVVASGGTYYVVVTDDDGEDGDTEVPYQLEVEVLQDRDENEPNDHPSTATPLSEAVVNCGAEWSAWMSASGSIASPGDNDWFALQLRGCLGGLIEAELVVGEGLSAKRAWELQQHTQAALSLVRSHPDTTCNDDEDCTSLNVSCDPDPGKIVAWECEGYFNSCLSEGRCAGATVCLPNGQCGANQVQRNYTVTAIPDPIEDAPDPPNAAIVSAPVLADGTYYLRASDFQADGGDPEGLYELRVRVRLDPDPGDATAPPNNLYTPLLRTDSLPVRESEARYVPITVAEDCETATWTTGALSYENDLDFFYYEHPCPELDCMLQFHIELDSGPVEPAVFIYRGGGLFSSFPVEAGTSGSFGGVGAGVDDCYYAYNGHSGGYTVLIRDIASDGRNWSAEQQYRFCIEKVSDGCEAPCMFYEGDGCGQPR